MYKLKYTVMIVVVAFGRLHSLSLAHNFFSADLSPLFSASLAIIRRLYINASVNYSIYPCDAAVFFSSSSVGSCMRVMTIRMLFHSVSHDYINYYIVTPYISSYFVCLFIRIIGYGPSLELLDIHFGRITENNQKLCCSPSSDAGILIM